MKIIKLAAAVPNGYCIVRVTIDEKGVVQKKIIRGGKSKCTTHNQLPELYNVDVEGIPGGLGETIDSGQTGEAYEQNKPMVQPQPIKEKIDRRQVAFPGQKEAPKRLHEGFGV